MEIKELDAMIDPKSVAVVGASATPGKIGHTVLLNLQKDKYPGKIFPVNPTADEILGYKNYKSVSEIPVPVDAAIITVPSKLVLNVIDDCGKAGVKALLIITSGFSEVGDKALEEEIVAKAHSYGMRILGPNIVGVCSNSGKFNGSFAPFLPFPGKASLITQSGALLIGIDAATYLRGIGFDKLISIGNMADVSFSELITWLGTDENTTCITLHIEGLKNGREFIDAAKKSTKPIVVLKAGNSVHGAAAAASHTGSLAGAEKIYNSAFQQGGIIQATDLDNLFDRTLALSLEPAMKGENVLIITNGGGVGVLGTDAAEKAGVPLQFAPDDVQAEFRKHMPEYGSAKNPVDLTGMAGNDWYYESVKYAISHPWVDALVILYCETAMTNPLEIAQSIKKALDESGVTDKPLTVSFVGGERCGKAMRWLVENGIPAYAAPDKALNAIGALKEYYLVQQQAQEKIAAYEDVNRNAALKIFDKARAEKRDSLTEIEAKQVFKEYGLPVTNSKLATSIEEAVEIAKSIGFPIVMKIVSPDILHKSDAGGVKVNIKNEAEVREAFQTIMENAKNYNANARIHGVVIQEMAPWGTEVILGSVNDATFGPTVMFGLGGIFVEVLKDVTFRVAPLSLNQAKRMIGEIRGAPILDGVRGEKPRDRDALAELICRYANMIIDLKDEIGESDANPVLVYEESQGLKVVDARIILKKK